MADARRETWITGIGIVSCLGEGADMHWQRLNAAPSVPDEQTFAPYPVHKLAPIELDKQIPKKGDQRQMEAWQRIGTYAAGLALDSAGAKGNAELLGRMDMIVAAGGGERDEAVDTAILSGLRKAENKSAFLNERLMGDLRPTLFLAQLSNLMAGNISIVHGVTGMSRTFMGEEAAGTDAVRIALSRIQSGQGEICLVGGAFNAERRDLLLIYEAGGHLTKSPFAPVWDRASRGGGMALGSLGAFLVLESREHATARNAKPLARLASVQSDRTRRAAGRRVERARADVEEHCAGACRGPHRGDFRRDRRRNRDRRGTRVADDAARRSRARHRHASRARPRAAIRHEYCACHRRAGTRKVVCTGGAVRSRKGHGRSPRPGCRDRCWTLARRRHGAGRSGSVKETIHGICVPYARCCDRDRRHHLARRRQGR